MASERYSHRDAVLKQQARKMLQTRRAQVQASQRLQAQEKAAKLAEIERQEAAL